MVVLVGSKTLCRKHVDWEISAGLNKKVGGYSGLIGILLPVLMLVAIAGFMIIRRQQFFGKASYLEIDEAEIGIGSGKVKLKANLEDLQIGFKFWTELTTRKIGLPLDEEHDVIVDVYNSWYEFFGIARAMIKSIPVSKIRDSQTTKELMLISVHILNKELRPHLTRWQAR